MKNMRITIRDRKHISVKVSWLFLVLVAVAVYVLASPASDARRKARPAMDSYRKAHPACEVCGKGNSLLKPLEVAHIKPVEVFADLASDTNNMMMMCFGCHRYLQHVGGNTKRYTVNLREWLAARQTARNP